MPQLKEADLKKQLKENTLDRFYFLYGDEKFLIAHYTQKLIDKVVPKAEPGFNYQIFEGDTATIDEVAEAGVSADHIHELCERDHCGCDEDEDEHEHGHGHDHGHEDEHEHHDGHGHSRSHEGAPLLSIIRSAISHTVQVSVFIFLVTLILVAVLETFGESAIEQFLRGNETLAVLGSALVGLIPNCSASVVITQLYLEGALQLAPMLAGTLISAGVGYLVLFRTNRSARENVLFLIMMYVIGAGWGLILSAVGL